MVLTRRSGRLADHPPSTPPKTVKRGQRKKPKAAAEDDVGEQQAADVEDVPMIDVTVSSMVTSGKDCAGKNKSVSKSKATSKRKLDETESEAEAASEAPTGEFHGDHNRDELISDLSSLEPESPAAELTPKPVSKPPKKKAREASPLNTPVKSGRAMVNANFNVTAQTGASKDNAIGGQAGASSALMINEADLATWMGVATETGTAQGNTTLTSTSTSGPAVRSSSARVDSAVVSSRSKQLCTVSSNNPGSKPLKGAIHADRSTDTLPPRTKAVPPPALAKPPKPTQNQPFRPDKTPMRTKGKGKAAAVKKTKGPVVSDDEEPERTAALSSPPKGDARPTSKHMVKVKEEQVSPRPVKLNINILEPTLWKNDQESGKQVGSEQGRGCKGKHKKTISDSEDGDSSDIEVLDEPLQTLKLPPSRDASRPQSRSRSPSTLRTSRTWHLKDIPELARPQWKTQVVPMLVRFQGARPDPWSVNDARFIWVVQLIWDAVYGDEIPHQVVGSDCMHGLASQSLCNWCSAIRAASESIVGVFFEQNSLTRMIEGRAAFSTRIMEGKRYLYEDPFNADNKRLFRSAFFLPILAFHFDHTRNALNIPTLFDKTIRSDCPLGIFGLAGAVLKRIFMLYSFQLVQPQLDKEGKPKQGRWRVMPQVNPKTGNMSTSQTEFSEERFSKRTDYFVTCTDTLSANRYNGVLTAAQGCTRVKLKVLKDTPYKEDSEEEELLEDGDSD